MRWAWMIATVLFAGFAGSPARLAGMSPNLTAGTARTPLIFVSRARYHRSARELWEQLSGWFNPAKPDADGEAR
jgi:hypothetical protein